MATVTVNSNQNLETLRALRPDIIIGDLGQRTHRGTLVWNRLPGFMYEAIDGIYDIHLFNNGNQYVLDFYKHGVLKLTMLSSVYPSIAGLYADVGLLTRLPGEDQVRKLLLGVLATRRVHVEISKGGAVAGGIAYALDEIWENGGFLIGGSANISVRMKIGLSGGAVVDGDGDEYTITTEYSTGGVVAEGSAQPEWFDVAVGGCLIGGTSVCNVNYMGLSGGVVLGGRASTYMTDTNGLPFPELLIAPSGPANFFVSLAVHPTMDRIYVSGVDDFLTPTKVYLRTYTKTGLLLSQSQGPISTNYSLVQPIYKGAKNLALNVASGKLFMLYNGVSYVTLNGSGMPSSIASATPVVTSFTGFKPQSLAVNDTLIAVSLRNDVNWNAQVTFQTFDAKTYDYSGNLQSTLSTTSLCDADIKLRSNHIWGMSGTNTFAHAYWVNMQPISPFTCDNASFDQIPLASGAVELGSALAYDNIHDYMYYWGTPTGGDPAALWKFPATMNNHGCPGAAIGSDVRVTPDSMYNLDVNDFCLGGLVIDPNTKKLYMLASGNPDYPPNGIYAVHDIT